MKSISAVPVSTQVALLYLVQLLLLYVTCPIEGFVPPSTINCKPQKRILLSSSPPPTLYSNAIKTTSHRRIPPLISHQDQTQHSLSYLAGQKNSLQLWMAGDVAEDDASENNDDNNEIETENDKNSFQRLKSRLFPKKVEEDGLTFRQKLAKAGMSVVLSYGWVSNLSYCVSVSIAWYIFTKSKQISPLAPGQWKPFLGVYAGFYVFNSVIRPFRFAVSVGVARYLDRVVANIQNVFKVNKGIAIFMTVILFNVLGTCSLMFAGVSLASLASGVPIFPGKP